MYLKVSIIAPYPYVSQVIYLNRLQIYPAL